MSFQNYLRIPTVVDIKSTEKVDAIRELVKELCKALEIGRKQKSFVEEILKREEAASTFIGQGIAIPHLRADIKDNFAIAVGRSTCRHQIRCGARGACPYHGAGNNK